MAKFCMINSVRGESLGQIYVLVSYKHPCTLLITSAMQCVSLLFFSFLLHELSYPTSIYPSIQRCLQGDLDYVRSMLEYILLLDSFGELMGTL